MTAGGAQRIVRAPLSYKNNPENDRVNYNENSFGDVANHKKK